MDLVIELLLSTAWFVAIIAPYVTFGAVAGVIAHRHGGKGLPLGLLTAIGAFAVVHEAIESANWWMLLVLLPILVPDRATKSG